MGKRQTNMVQILTLEILFDVKAMVALQIKATTWYNCLAHLETSPNAVSYFLYMCAFWAEKGWWGRG